MFEGAAPPPPPPVTVAVYAETACADPPAFLAVTTTSILSPTSEPCNVYDELVAPKIFEHELAQSCH